MNSSSEFSQCYCDVPLPSFLLNFSEKKFKGKNKKSRDPGSVMGQGMG